MKNFNKIYNLLSQNYIDPLCGLSYTNPYQLLVSSRLSAQCTDLRVNIVTMDLFKKYPDFDSLAKAELSEVEKIVYPCGFYHVKSRDIIAASKKIIETGKVPDTLEGFLELPGVGRKIANLLMGEIYNAKGVIIADTHCIRLSNRLGFCSTKDPHKVEKALREIVPEDISLNFCHLLVAHGRKICKAQNPDCDKCFLKDYCLYTLQRRRK